MTTRLLFIMADRPSLLAEKGELPEGYYNPADLFDEVHLLTTSSDATDPALLKGVGGRATLHIHRLWSGSDLANLALSPILRRQWTSRANDLAREIQPDLVRSGDRLTGYLGARVKEKLCVPHIISLHAERDDLRARLRWGGRRALLKYEQRYARYAFPRADAVIIVYQSLEPFARRYGARRTELVYNVVCPGAPPSKDDYGLADRPRIVSVGRHIDGKVCDALIRCLPDVEADLTLIGDGPRRAYLQDLASELGVQDRVTFQTSMANDELVQALPAYDLFSTYSDFPGIPKAVMEAMWVGLPVVINDNRTHPVPELEGDWVCQVENTPSGYGQAIVALLADESRRRALGRRAREFSIRTFGPDEMEARVAALYRELVPNLFEQGQSRCMD